MMDSHSLIEDLGMAAGAAPAIALTDAVRSGEAPEIDLVTSAQEGKRRFSIYAPSAAFGLIDELDFLARRAIDRNVFFAPQFLVPAMPRLDERRVRLTVIRDETAGRSRLRLLMPFSIEGSGLIGGPKIIRAWTHPFGPLGTILVDSDDPDGALTSFLQTLARPELGFPDLLVLPDVRLGEPMAEAIGRVAADLGLPIAQANGFSRAALIPSGRSSHAYLHAALSAKRRRELKRQRRLLEAEGVLSFDTARRPDDVRRALEEFLDLEAGGWKGRERSALVMDRFRAAFAREAVNKLAEADGTRVFTLRLDNRPIASLVAFVSGGEAFAWKTAYDEAHGRASPGFQLLAMATEALCADPAVERVDSCAVPDHFLMNRLWRERICIATLVIGLSPNSGARVDAAVRALETMRRTRNFTRLMREKLASMMRRG